MVSRHSKKPHGLLFNHRSATALIQLDVFCGWAYRSALLFSEDVVRRRCLFSVSRCCSFYKLMEQRINASPPHRRKDIPHGFCLLLLRNETHQIYLRSHTQMYIQAQAFPPYSDGSIDLSKIAFGIDTVQQAFGISTIPAIWPSTGAVPSSM